MVFEPCVLFPPAAVWGGGNRSHGPNKLVQSHFFISKLNSFFPFSPPGLPHLYCNIIAALINLFLLRAEEKQLSRQNIQIRPKTPSWSNYTARGSGEGHCFQYRYIIATVEAIGTSTITVVSIPCNIWWYLLQ